MFFAQLAHFTAKDMAVKEKQRQEPLVLLAAATFSLTARWVKKARDMFWLRRQDAFAFFLD